MKSENEAPRSKETTRRPYARPELVRLQLRTNGDNVVGNCKSSVGAATNSAPSATCDACSSIGS